MIQNRILDMKKIVILLISIQSIFYSSAFAQLETFPQKVMIGSQDPRPTPVKRILISNKIVSGKFNCDSKMRNQVCMQKQLITSLDFQTPITIYCPLTNSKRCPEIDECTNNRFDSHGANQKVLEAAAILTKLQFDGKSIKKKPTKEEALKIVTGINNIDIEILKNLPSKNLKDIEEFKSLGIDKQLKVISINEEKYGMAMAVTAAGAVGLYLATKAAYDVAYGADRLKHNEIKKKMFNEKQFDLKN